MKNNSNRIGCEGERTINMQFRVNETEAKAIEERRQAVGIRNRSAFLRKMALNGICVHVEITDLHEASKLLAATSNNMNQYARKANTDGSIYQEDIESMKDNFSELIKVYGEVLSKLNTIYEGLDKL